MLSRLLSKLKSLLGWGATETESASDPTSESSESDEQADYECAVCGTGTSDPGGSCPLCQSSQIVPAGEAEPQGGSVKDEPLSGGPTTVRSNGNPDDAAKRLQELREEQVQQDGDNDP